MPGISWPALPSPQGAADLALQFQLDRTQWLSADALRAEQMRQLAVVMRHCWDTVPHYRERLAFAGYVPETIAVEEMLSRLPVLTRAEVQAAGDALLSRAVPAEHGPLFHGETSGATGRPVSYCTTRANAAFWRAGTLRDHSWHGRDFGGKLAAIRYLAGSREREAFAGWGVATDAAYRTGPSVVLSIHAPVSVQLEWLVREAPDYLLTYPSNLEALAEASRRSGMKLSRLREVRTMSEVVNPELRALVREVWGVPLADAYSAEEVGYIALQCPDHEHYHVQSENLIVEVLDDEGRPCPPGESGRVVVTALHNFAMPLLRYELGDYAVAGAPCRCGRGLPVLQRILGRVRNMLRLAGGERYWPMLGTRGFARLAPVLQHQFVQTAYDRLELRIVAARPLTSGEEAALREHVTRRLPAPMQVDIRCCADIPRSAGGKFEDFVCALD